MTSAPLPPDERERLAALDLYTILDTLPEQEFDDLTQIASTICETPIALISFIDRKRQWFKSRVGLETAETSRDLAFCAHAILQDELFQVVNADEDERFAENPLVTDEPNVKFYAGAPLITPEGYKIGTLCVIDDHPRTLNDSQREALEALSRQVMSLLELRLKNNRITRAEQAKSLFLANMSHEIRTPMNAVLSCTRLMTEKSMDSESQKLLAMIQHSGDSLLTIINDILDFTKIETGNVELNIEPYSLTQLMRELVALMQNRAEEQNKSLMCHINDHIPEKILGDANRIRQIVLNLLGNALKFSQKNVYIDIDCLSTEAEQSILIQIKDDGTGIPLSEQAIIFNSFEQGSHTLTSNASGTGLGLAICRALITLMGGKIWVESVVGEGACFFVRIPLQVAQQSVEQTHDEQSGIVAREYRSGIKVLLAEDDAVNQIITEKVMQKLGYHIDIVNNGRDAVDAVEKAEYEIVLMDIRMPVMDGIQATQEIRKLPVKQPSIVAITANAFDDDRKACLEAGMNAFLTKPLNFKKLSDTLLSIEANILKIK